jgi:hypothetical protein
MTKPTAKATGTTDTGEASSYQYTMKIKWGSYDEDDKTKKGIVSVDIARK